MDLLFDNGRYTVVSHTAQRIFANDGYFPWQQN